MYNYISEVLFAAGLSLFFWIKKISINNWYFYFTLLHPQYSCFHTWGHGATQRVCWSNLTGDGSATTCKVATKWGTFTLSRCFQYFLSECISLIGSRTFQNFCIGGPIPNEPLMIDSPHLSCFSLCLHLLLYRLRWTLLILYTFIHVDPKQAP